VRWEDKIELAMHTGNVGSPFRKRLALVAGSHPDTMLVNELFIGDHNKIRRTCHELGLERKGGFQQHLCYMTFQQQCRYKYLLNSASIGYANKFKYLLLCGSVVIYVREGMYHQEFYELGLLPGIHYVSVPDAAAVPAMVRWLKANDAYARAVAMAGRARMAALTTDAVADYVAELLKQCADDPRRWPR
jgi:protein glucosyltransferase